MPAFEIKAVICLVQSTDVESSGCTLRSYGRDSNENHILFILLHFVSCVYTVHKLEKMLNKSQVDPLTIYKDIQTMYRHDPNVNIIKLQSG